MKRILACGLILGVAACASTTPLVTSPVQYQVPHPRLQAQFDRAQTLASDYAAKSKGVVLERRMIDGLALTAGLATLGFGAFDAHPDNVTAAALTTGVTSGVRPLLGMDENYSNLESGRLALDCIMRRSTLLRLGPGSVSPMFADTTAFSAPLGIQTAVAGTDDITTIDFYLAQLIFIAESQSDPSQALKSALENARQARNRLAIGINAHREAPGRVDKAIDAVAKAVKFKRADISGLLEAIGKVELPKPEPVPGTGTEEGGAKAMTNAGVDLAMLLNLLAARVSAIAPEMEEETLKSVTACPVEYFAK